MANKKQGYVQNENEFEKYLNTMKSNAEDRGIRLLYCVASSPWAGTVSRVCGTTTPRESEDCVGCMITDLLATVDTSEVLTLMSNYLHNTGRTSEAAIIRAMTKVIDDLPVIEGEAKL